MALIYIGTWTGGESEGIYAAEFDPASGVSAPRLAAKAPQPTWITRHPSLPILYASHAVGTKEKPDAIVTTYQIEDDGTLSEISTTPTGGGRAAHIAIDATGKFASVSHYASGVLSLLPLAEDGSFGGSKIKIQHEGSGPNKKRQEAPHVHFSTFDPSNRWLLACDLGSDNTVIYAFSAEDATLQPIGFAEPSLPGAGPRHLAFQPDGKTFYVANELNGTLDVFHFDPDSGEAEPAGTAALGPDQQTGALAASHILLDPSSRWLFVGVRVLNQLALYSIDPETDLPALHGHLPTGGKFPRGFNLTTDGKFLLTANEHSHDLFAYAFDPETGETTPLGNPIHIPEPVCIVV